MGAANDQRGAVTFRRRSTVHAIEEKRHGAHAATPGQQQSRRQSSGVPRLQRKQAQHPRAAVVSAAAAARHRSFRVVVAPSSTRNGRHCRSCHDRPTESTSIIRHVVQDRLSASEQVELER